jgi:hypothetical protein
MCVRMGHGCVGEGCEGSVGLRRFICQAFDSVRQRLEERLSTEDLGVQWPCGLLQIVGQGSIVH